MSIAFSGLAGTGKTTIAQTLALKLAVVYLRIDTSGNQGVQNGQADIEAVG